MKRRLVLPLALVVGVLAGCGGSKPIKNDALASDLSKRLSSSSPLVCWDKTGSLGAMSAMGYTRVCGIARSKPSIYIRTGTGDKTGWCVVTPRYLAAPRCSLG
ncbi:MAG TPA: hypothetical protein VLK36_01845 [Gaiellaceae bacterium]|nr:hypothetical protein [Gaiellaceae bacterium]